MLPEGGRDGDVRVLLVDDDHEDYLLTLALVREIPGAPYSLEWEKTYELGLEALRRGDHSVCLLDHRLGARTGLDLLHELGRIGCNVPVIILTSEDPGGVEPAALAAGAADYLVKGAIDADQLWRALRHAVQRKRALDALRARERLFRAVFDGAGDAMLISDDDGRYLDGNPAALALFGVTRDELMMRTVPEFSARPSQIVDAWHGFLREGGVEGEYELLRPDGQRRVLEHRSTANILPHRHLSVLRDVTDRSREQQARERLVTIVQHADDAVIAIEIDGTVAEWNPSAERLFGYTAAEAIGRGFGALIVPPDRSLDWSGAHESLRRGLTVRGLETSAARKNGRTCDVSITSSPFRDASGRVFGGSFVVRDISETKRLRARLAISDRMASLGTLAAGLAHEINNPLAAVILDIDVAANDLATLTLDGRAALTVRRARDALQDAMAAAEQARAIVVDLKVFSGPDDQGRDPVDVNRTAESAIRMARNETRHRASVVTDFGTIPAVDGNSARLGQVFLNLLVNAAHAIPEGAAPDHEIRVTTRLVAEEVVIEVSDSGTGISPDSLERLFDPFFTTKPRGQGTGLGLPICHSIISSMGGQIAFSTNLRKGTTVTVTLPVGRAVARAPRAPSVMAPAPAVRRARVLVIDDEPALVRALTRTLAGEHDVVGVCDAREALARLHRGERYDVILTDLMMPHMTGMEFHEELCRVWPELSGRVVFLCGGACTQRARAFLDDARNTRLDKPFEPAALRKLVRELAS